MKGRCQCATSKESGSKGDSLTRADGDKTIENIERKSVILPIHAANARNHRVEAPSLLSFSAINLMCKRKSAVHARKGVASVQPVKACDQRGRQVFSVTRSKKIAHKRAWPLRNRRAEGTIQKNPYDGWCPSLSSRAGRATLPLACLGHWQGQIEANIFPTISDSQRVRTCHNRFSGVKAKSAFHPLFATYISVL